MKPIMIQILCVISLILAGYVSHSHANQHMKLVKLDNLQNGAMCLDGSPPAYYFQKGKGDGNTKWIVHLMGGAWCFTEEKINLDTGELEQPEWANCYDRSKITFDPDKDQYAIGSTNDLSDNLHDKIGGILSDDEEINPDFYNWNHVFVVYCDGFSFAGDRVMKVKGEKLYSRGRKILTSVLKDLAKTKGMDVLTDFLLTGCSAGGLATYLHTDFVFEQLEGLVKTPEYRYKALADAGYLLDVENLLIPKPFPSHLIQYLMTLGINTHNPIESLNQECLTVNEDEKWKCVFVQHFFKYIKTPVFTVNSKFDKVQLKGNRGLKCIPLVSAELVCPQSSDPDECKTCSPEDTAHFYEFGKTFKDQAEPILSSPNSGVFITNCLTHCQTIYDDRWKIEIKAHGNYFSMRYFVAAWWYANDGGGDFKVIDDKTWPSNPTCPAIYRIEPWLPDFL